MSTKGRKRSQESIAKMVATKRAKSLANRQALEESLRQQKEQYEAERREPAPDMSAVSEAEEFGAFLGAAWRVYKGL
jgi:pyridoxine/pyridoxamine 5'-phosphate oxidase